jgi:hypothetical protein
MKNTSKSRRASRAGRVTHAICETLEERRLLSAPHVLPAGPRESRPDYMPSTMDGYFPTSPDHFEWEFTSPKLVYPFDQPVSGASNQTHSLTTLYDAARALSGNTYPTNAVPVGVVIDFVSYSASLNSTDWTNLDRK